MHKLKTLVAVVSVVLSFSMSVIFSNSAQATTFNYYWKGHAGYLAQGSFSYDETKGYSVITPNELDSLTISFFDPSNNLLKTYINVGNSKNTGADPFLEFNFDPSTESFFGNFDVGEGTLIGENDFYLNGTLNSTLELRNLDLHVLDQDSGFISVQKITVPEPSGLAL